MSRLAFQTQLASIMEVLANAAVAEICKLVDDDYAVVTLQMSQVQKENKALKRKLHLLELKMARGTAERRLREREGRGGLRVTITGGERIRELSPNSDAALFSPWPHRSITSGLREDSEPQSKSPDVEFVEPEPLVVKEETKTETKEEEVHLIEDNVVMETPPLEPLPSASSQAPPPPRRRGNSAPSRRVEDEDPDIVLVKVEEPEEPKTKTRKSPGLSIQEGLVESSTDDFRSASQTSTNQLSASSPGLSESGSVLTKPLGSDLGLFELEPLLSHWAPNTAPPGGSTAPPGGPFSSASSAQRREGEVIDLDDTEEFEKERRDNQLRVSQTQALSSLQIRSVHSQWTPAVLLPNHPGPSQQQTASNSSAPTLPANPGAPTLPTNPGVPTLPTNPGAPTLSTLPCLSRRGPNPTRPAPDPKAKGPRKLECRTCGKTFPAWSNLEIHQRVHTGEKPFVCHTCGKRFSEAGNLKKHQRVHTGEKPYGCEGCGKRFAWICNLKTHRTSCNRQQQSWEPKQQKI